MRLLYAVLPLLISGPAMALSGNDLAKFCGADGPAGEAASLVCDMKIENVVDGANSGAAITAAMRGAKGRSAYIYFPFCLPTGTSSAQYRAVVVKYLQDFPERRHEPAGQLIVYAMAQAFPIRACQ